MGIHGVGESDYVKLSNMKSLYGEVQKADKILNF